MQFDLDNSLPSVDWLGAMRWMSRKHILFQADTIQFTPGDFRVFVSISPRWWSARIELIREMINAIWLTFRMRYIQVSWRNQFLEMILAIRPLRGSTGAPDPTLSCSPSLIGKADGEDPRPEGVANVWSAAMLRFLDPGVGLNIIRQTHGPLDSGASSILCLISV